MSAKTHILIVDDEPNTLASLSRAFRLEGHEATVCDNAERALELAKSQPFDLILSDVVMPGRDGLTLLSDLQRNHVTTPVVMMSGQANVRMALDATVMGGAVDFLEKPISTEKLLVTLSNALKLNRLETENYRLRRRMGPQIIVGSSDVMRKVEAQLKRVAGSETRVCIYGETGTGKELAARFLHDFGPRGGHPFITVNCAAVPPELIESELFGHEKGSFTGAFDRHIGKFEQAHHGTLFLDEIGDMPLNMQAKLLRVLEEGVVERIGGTKPVPVDVRVIVATHRDLWKLVRQHQFREDLYHRVVVFPIKLPALRERVEDIPELVEHFVAQVCIQNGWKAVPVAPDAMEALKAYPWPGNVRELRNIVERLFLLATSGTVDAATVELALPPAKRDPEQASSSEHVGTLSEQVTQFEREAILVELERQQFHITNAAKALGLERSHLYKKCQQLGIDLQAPRASAEN
ncbi:MAG TPA: sigma-54 dependent transcriptional regulator [Terriglobales bacterium]|nr:sigma-54 dependent transcriptional regulator [Terriglobales bacterium]